MLQSTAHIYLNIFLKYHEIDVINIFIPQRRKLGLVGVMRREHTMRQEHTINKVTKIKNQTFAFLI